MVHVLVGYCVSLGTNRGVRIYGTLARTPKVIKKKNIIVFMKATRVTEAFNVYSTAQAHVMGIIEPLLDCFSH